MKLNKNFIIIILILGILGLTYTFVRILESNHTYYQKEINQAYSNGYKEGYLKGKEEVKQTIENKLLNSLTNTNKDSIEYFISTEEKLEKIMLKSNPKITKDKIVEYKKYIMKWSKKYDLPPLLVASVIHRETNYKNHLVSSVGAKGPMQVYPKWHKDKLKKLGITEKELSNINHGINVGCMILKEYLSKHNEDYRQALYSYVGVIKNTRTGEIYVRDIFNMIKYSME